MVDDCLECRTEFVVVFLIRRKVSAELIDTFANLFGGFFYLKRFESLEDGLQVCEERGGGHNDHAVLARRTLNEVFGIFADRTDFVDEEIVVDRFVGDEHECKVHCVVLRLDVFACFCNAFFEVAHKLFFESITYTRIGCFDETVVVFE